MTMRTITAAELAGRCDDVLDEVAGGGAELLVLAEDGRPLARILSAAAPAPAASTRSLVGSVTFLCTDDELIYGSSPRWTVEG